MAMFLVKQCVLRVCVQCATKYRTVHTSRDLFKIVQFKLSDIGEGIREVTVNNWFVKVDDTVSQFDDVCEVESDKAAVTITSRFDGKIKKLYYNIGDTALVGNPLMDIDLEDEEVRSEPEMTESSVKDNELRIIPESSQESNAETWNKSLATPAVRRIAMENNIKLSDVKGTGKLGRVMKEDILEYLGVITVKTVPSDQTKPLTTIQKVMTKTMTKSQSIPTLAFYEEVNVTKLVQLKKEFKTYSEKKKIKLTYLPFFLKTLSKSLLEYPILNSSLDESMENIIYKKSHNIGIAVDSPSGLIVPNIKNLQNLTIVDIARELTRLIDAASVGKLTPSDLTGGTFSVSNIGSVGGTYADPLIVHPEVCIVAIGKIQTLPRFDHQGNVSPTDILYISIAADHRIIDGATVAKFTNLWKSYLEQPSVLMLEL